MLVYSKKRLLPTTPDILMLMGTDDKSYFYLDRKVYDIAVILSDQYDIDSLNSMINGTYNRSSIDYFYEHAPKPIDILAPFLGLVTGDIEKDMEVLTGVIHAMSEAINFKQYVKKESDLRKSVRFSLTVKEEYQLAWERFLYTTIPYDEKVIQGARMFEYMEKFFGGGMAMTSKLQNFIQANINGFKDINFNTPKEIKSSDTNKSFAFEIESNKNNDSKGFEAKKKLHSKENVNTESVLCDEYSEEDKATATNHISRISEEEKRAQRKALGIDLG